MSLQSYLFFGSANGLYQNVKALLARRPDCRFLVFDFRLVTGIDSSAKHSFTQIKQAAEDLGTRLVLVNLPPDLRRTLSPILSDDIIADDLDYALESCHRRSFRPRRQRPQPARVVFPGARQRGRREATS